MFLQLLLATFIGISFGIITGLIPGIHINLVSLTLLTLSPLLLTYTNVLVLSVFIIAMSITHTFLDFIPSVFLGAPESDTALSILPGHKMLLQGKAYEAVKLTVIGSLFALIFSIVLIPLLIPTVSFIYPFIKSYIGFILIGVVSFMILKDKTKLGNLLVFMLSGTLGLIVLTTPNIKNSLFPLLSGLFGVSMLSLSLLDKVKIPEQKITHTVKLPAKEYTQSITAGTFAGVLTSFFPGLGAAQGAVLAQQFTKNLSEHGFMVLVGGINTVNFVLSLVTLLTLNKARNGAVIVVSKLLDNYNIKVLAVFIAVALIVAGIATFLALNITKIFSRIIVKVNYTLLVIIIIALITLLTFYFSGFIGLLILFTATMIGIIPSQLNVSRNHAMGCLLLPVILYFIL